MNAVIFRHIFDDTAVQEAMIAAFSSQDDLGCFLRVMTPTY